MRMPILSRIAGVPVFRASKAMAHGVLEGGEFFMHAITTPAEPFAMSAAGAERLQLTS
jgi:hypothetical protein